MPLIKVELARGKERGYLLELQNTVLAAVREALKLPEDDRNIRLIQHDPDFFILKPPYELLVEITLFSGRSKEVKKQLFRHLVDTLHEKLEIAPETVFIVLSDQPLENWGGRGGVAADEVNLGFKIDV